MDRLEKRIWGVAVFCAVLSVCLSYLYLSSIFSQALRMITVGYDSMGVLRFLLSTRHVGVVAFLPLGFERLSERSQTKIRCSMSKKIRNGCIMDSGFFGVGLGFQTTASSGPFLQTRDWSRLSTLFLDPGFLLLRTCPFR